MFNIDDFLPSYPDYKDNKLNVFPEGFYKTIYYKKEFEILKPLELRPIPGKLYAHQENIAKFLSPYTPYDSVLLYGEVGTGKTCSAVATVELAIKIIPEIKGLVLVPGKQFEDNFKEELVFKCTSGKYIPEDYLSLSKLTQVRRINKLIKKNYTLDTFEIFSNKISKFSDEFIKFNYSNKVIIIDEAHHIRYQPRDIKKKEGKKEKTVSIYKQFHRFLHLVENCKILLLTGTPARDDPEEIAEIMNLILPLKNQLPIKEEFNKFFDKNNNFIASNKLTLQKAFHGRVSFIRAMTSNITQIYEGRIPVETGMKNFKIVMLEMSSFQSKNYIRAYKDDIKKTQKDEITETKLKKGFYDNSRQASMFVYPISPEYIKEGVDGIYGKEGYNKYIDNKSGDFKALKNLITNNGKSTQEEIIFNIKKCGNKIGVALDLIINNTDKLTFVYSKFVRGSGTILFSKLLELFGYSRIKIKSKTDFKYEKKKRYALITGRSEDKLELKRIKSVFNSPENINGEYIQVIIGSKVIGEGISFFNITQTCILTPHWNNAETEQAIGRTTRLLSHSEKLRYKEMRIYRFASYMENQLEKCIDIFMYRLSEIKQLKISQILRILKEMAFDCPSNYLRNIKNTDIDYSKDCDYQKCGYKCMEYSDGEYSSMDMEERKLILDTYNLFYADKDIERIIEEIKNIYRTSFSFNILQLFNLFPEVSTMVVVRSLKRIIDDNIPITNKYGIKCYLREDDNLYFHEISYYTKKPRIKEEHKFDSVIEKVQVGYLKEIIKYLKEISTDEKNKDVVEYHLNILDKKIQEELLESAMSSSKTVSWNKLREIIILTFKDYLSKYKDSYVSGILYPQIRCMDIDKKKWIDCSELLEKIEKKEVKAKDIKKK